MEPMPPAAPLRCAPGEARILSRGQGFAGGASTDSLVVPDRRRWEPCCDEETGLAVLAAGISAWRTALPQRSEAPIGLLPAGFIRVNWPIGSSQTPRAWAGVPTLVIGTLTAWCCRLLRTGLRPAGDLALAEVPCRHVVFGADFLNYDADEYGWELQALFIFERATQRIVHATTKFAGTGWRAWLFASKDMSLHIAELPEPLGRVLLLDCHDLATLAQRRVDPTGELKCRRDTLMKLVRAKPQPITVLSTWHTRLDTFRHGPNTIERSVRS